ncbi:hypothetical protein PNP85_12395 [Halobacterium salinarum]|uniref:hypothetical protein n=1 Tax=Halobacterium salinarum TaxID=2242 RepID=UPI002554BCAF|nr:hypothetical protein [Halobacterium salinarum]MDL0140302.1 hypothetical protein [Halobacterium salinarum]
MTLSDVIPVAVPLDPGGPESVTVPAKTHLMYYCRLAPVVPVSGLSDQSRDSWRTKIFRALLETTSASLAIDGTQIGLVEEVIRPAGEAELGFWNLKNPLPVGTHKATLYLTVEPRPGVNKISCATYPSEKPIELSSDDGLTLETTISVIEANPEEFQSGRDPFWNRKAIHFARH